MQSNFVEALVNTHHTVLDRRLHDFCLYDALALTVAGNPLWIGGIAEMDHLQQAVLICSLEHGRFLNAELDPRTWPERLKRLLWKNRNRTRDFQQHFTLWKAYVDDFDAIPEFWPGDKGTPIRTPALYAIASFIETHSNMTHGEILTAPIGMMFWKSATLAERLGIAPGEVMTEDEIEIGKEQAKAAKAEDVNLDELPAVEESEEAGHA